MIFRMPSIVGKVPVRKITAKRPSISDIREKRISRISRATCPGHFRHPSNHPSIHRFYKSVRLFMFTFNSFSISMASAELSVAFEWTWEALGLTSTLAAKISWPEKKFALTGRYPRRLGRSASALGVDMSWLVKWNLRFGNGQNPDCLALKRPPTSQSQP